ncbi:hypothetical protein [Streptomyces tropicalis]|uniref:Uncharacterized protein n=1 Tax=Streptomyces tropicalis TaxID=3034234 RepID=A0ABT5ZY12_9ACTN|nr:hypothetical protein [Streptomyces tropicalis]MDF3297280.1 hypothetical protein [Streptomyces tropicalis]
MSDASTTQPQSAGEAEEATGHGKHRGSVSSQEAGATPRGRHRKPGEQSEAAA